MQELPGISVNVNGGPESDDEIWLTVERLHETRPPEISSTVLRPWVQMTQSATEEPRLLESTDGTSLIAAGTFCSSTSSPEEGKQQINPDATIILSDYDRAAQVRAQFVIFIDTKWRPWAKEEKLRRETIHIYSKLFTLKQQLEGGIVDALIELVWGVGLGVWNWNSTKVGYPLIGRLVELSLSPVTAQIEIRPRDVDAQLEIDWYTAVGNSGVADLEKAAKDFFGKSITTFSPFDRGTFEPLLRTAVTHLDANGIYWPNEVPAEDRTLPNLENKLKVTDTWVLFARPRTNSLFLQDLVKLKKQAEETDIYPPAVASIVTDPDTSNPVVVLPNFRGVSASYQAEYSRNDMKARDLYFPKPFNDEQVRIVQLLDISDGVVVQGPPGTGKTHTIANIICHYLAEGKRVLVTSMKDPALAVLQEFLPAEIRPLAISLLTSEQEGMKQFEYAIDKIASEVQRLDRISTARAIHHLEESIDALHGKLAGIDRNISEWAKRNLAKITLDAEEIAPQDAAHDVVDNASQFEWIPDALGAGPEFAPQFSDADIVLLREARRALARDIDYISASLPQLVEFPDSKTLVELHHDLSHFEKLKEGVERGDVPALSDSSKETLNRAQQLLMTIGKLRNLRDGVMQAGRPWTQAMRQRLRRAGDDELHKILEALGTELGQAVERRKKFLEQPVATPAGMELDNDIIKAVNNLAEGKRPFGLKGLFGRTEQKKQLDNIRVLGNPPADTASWEHVAEYLALLKALRELALRWNSLAHELPLEIVPDDKPEGGLAASQSFALFSKVKEMVTEEGTLYSGASRIFPTWSHSLKVADDEQCLAELEKALRHHLTKNRLANVWVNKEHIQKVLAGRTGRVIDDIRSFLAETLGSSGVTDAEMQSKWSALMTELSRVLGLGSHLTVVHDACNKVEASGAPGYAAALKQPIEGTVDRLLPDNWRTAWRLRRLATYLESINAQEELKKLAKDRHEVEDDLSRSYRDTVVKRTWLKLAENASPSIRAALQAYLNAIKNIGRGSRGAKRAVRYRHDARKAASLANPAVPCWIMAHYRVSESLPAELGCFDLVIIDEASQSDFTALPSLLRAKKALIVGDDKQVSPEGVGLEEKKVLSLMDRFLSSQVETYRQQMSPERSIYDLFKVVFAKSAVMLKEHFRCVGPIIEYSKREFYNHELRPLRVPKASERLDPPLIDVMVEDGYRKGDVNLPEARFIVDEIKAIVEDPNMGGRSIGVVSLLADKQALEIWERLTQELGPEIIQRHRITCGDAWTFQGKERDIMFLSMVSAPNEDVITPLSRNTFAQRFNVAASRARDRMYLVRSVGLEHLSNADRLRRSLIAHFSAPFAQNEIRVENLRLLCESPFEREMYDELTQRGYCVTPQVGGIDQYRIDMVVEGHNDTRLAVECDGDKYHGPDKWADDVKRQRALERTGWIFWRCFASDFIRRRQAVLDDLIKTLAERGIEPIGAEGAPRSVHTEHRIVSSSVESTVQAGSTMPIEALISADAPNLASNLEGDQSEKETSVPVDAGQSSIPIIEDHIAQEQLFASSVKSQLPNLPIADYVECAFSPGLDPRIIKIHQVAEGIIRIIEVEGPVVVKRVYDIYLRGCGIKRMGHELQSTMNKALSYTIRQECVVCEDESGKSDQLYFVARIKGTPPIRLRSRGQRSFEEIPPSELQVMGKYLLKRRSFPPGSDEHLRAVLEFFNLKRLTTYVGTTLLEILERSFPYVDEFLGSLDK